MWYDINNKKIDLNDKVIVIVSPEHPGVVGRPAVVVCGCKCYPDSNWVGIQFNEYENGCGPANWLMKISGYNPDSEQDVKDHERDLMDEYHKHHPNVEDEPSKSVEDWESTDFEDPFDDD